MLFLVWLVYWPWLVLQTDTPVVPSSRLDEWRVVFVVKDPVVDLAVCYSAACHAHDPFLVTHCHRWTLL